MRCFGKALKLTQYPTKKDAEHPLPWGFVFLAHHFFTQDTITLPRDGQNRLTPRVSDASSKLHNSIKTRQIPSQIDQNQPKSVKKSLKLVKNYKTTKLPTIAYYNWRPLTANTAAVKQQQMRSFKRGLKAKAKPRAFHGLKPKAQAIA